MAETEMVIVAQEITNSGKKIDFCLDQRKCILLKYVFKSVALRAVVLKLRMTLLNGRF